MTDTNELAERNQTLHLASAFLRRGWRCWAEVHWSKGASRRLDLLAWDEESSTLVLVEAKKANSPEQITAIAADVGRIASFGPIAWTDDIDQLKPAQRFGIVLATTWKPEIARWWNGWEGEDPWPAGTRAWDAVRLGGKKDPNSGVVKTANKGLWRAVALGTTSATGETGHHHLLYAIWPIPETS